jgi:Asp-tRNA(Asn)/Glu-tRNA(Gln) amidotransferase A subunit family amidase
MRPPQGLISQHRIVPSSAHLGTAGPTAKTGEHLANLLDVLVKPTHSSTPAKGYMSALTSWSGLRVGVLDPEEFFLSSDVMNPK